MTVAAADLMKAINTAWDASGLDAIFKTLWEDPATVDYFVLNEQQAAPNQPWPYCVIDQMSPRTTARMSGGSNRLREIRDTMVTLNIHASEVSGDARSAKQIAAYLAEEVMKQFGGHPTIAAARTLTLDNGHVLIVQYQTDYCVRTDDSESQWVISYIIRQDVPVMA